MGSSDSDGSDDPMSQVAVVVSDTAYASPTTPLKASYDDGDDRRSSSNNKRSSSKHRTLQDKKRKSKTPGIAKELLWSLRYLIPLLYVRSVWVQCLNATSRANSPCTPTIRKQAVTVCGRCHGIPTGAWCHH